MSEVKKYRRKEVDGKQDYQIHNALVEAMQFSGSAKDHDRLFSFVGYYKRDSMDIPIIKAFVGDMKVRRRWYVVKNIDGDIFVYLPDLFEQNYEEVTDDVDL